MSLADALFIATGTPVFISIVLNLWSRYWEGRFPGASLRPARHGQLVVAEAILVVVAFTVLPGPNGAAALAGLYAVLGIGVVVVYRRRGRVDCGCWGSGSTVRPQLAAFDFAIAGVALGTAWLDPTLSSFEGVVAIAFQLVFAVIVGLWLPEFGRTYKGLREQARPHRDAVLHPSRRRGVAA